MLVLSRKTGERIHIGENIVVEIRRIAGNRVTLALEAPRDVRILRGELQAPAREFREPSAEPRPSACPTEEVRIPVLHAMPTQSPRSECMM